MHATAREAPVHAERAPGVSIETLPEHELALAYVARDDARAFRELYRRLRPFLFAVARRRVISDDVADDLVQQAFLNAHAARHRFRAHSDFRPWLTRIVVNLALDHRRAARLRVALDVDPAELPAPAGPDASDRRRDAAVARRALAALCPRQRQVVEMHWLEERSFPEVAAALGEGLSAVKVRAHRACRELRSAVSSAR
jgi:RNA polymerase sigma-70 factor (ECF subfamily)